MEYTTLKLQLVENDVSVKKLQEQYSITSNCLQELGDKSPPLGNMIIKFIDIFQLQLV